MLPKSWKSHVEKEERWVLLLQLGLDVQGSQELLCYQVIATAPHIYHLRVLARDHLQRRLPWKEQSRYHLNLDQALFQGLVAKLAVDQERCHLRFCWLNYASVNHPVTKIRVSYFMWYKQPSYSEIWVLFYVFLCSNIKYRYSRFLCIWLFAFESSSFGKQSNTLRQKMHESCVPYTLLMLALSYYSIVLVYIGILQNNMTLCSSTSCIVITKLPFPTYTFIN